MKSISKIFLKLKALIVLIALVSQTNCSQIKDDIVYNPAVTNLTTGPNQIDFWLTKGDQTVKLQKQNAFLQFGSSINNYPSIAVDETQTFQTIDGFGYTLTGGSAQVINTLNPTKKTELLQELFGSNANSISISYLRISIGASDLNTFPFTYNDGVIDPTLANFSLAQDAEVIALLKEILIINPSIKIMGSPWTAPIWMKDNNSFVGGSLKPQYFGLYAQYFVKYIKAMKLQGITIDAITPQNEPLFGGNNPSMIMTAIDQANFIKNNLGPAFQAASLSSTKIVCFDHNCDTPEYPISILNNTAAAAFINGSAFHLYGGEISALTTVHNAKPTKNIYFTEQWTQSTGSFDVDLKWNTKNVVIGSMRNWSKNALQWNLATDNAFGPNTVGGCFQCKGPITINDANTYSRNVAYYTIAHASKFVPAGSVRIASNVPGNLNNVAFKTPTGKKVLIVENDDNKSQIFRITFNSKWVNVSLDAGSVGTFIW